MHLSLHALLDSSCPPGYAVPHPAAICAWHLLIACQKCPCGAGPGRLQITLSIKDSNQYTDRLPYCDTDALKSIQACQDMQNTVQELHLQPGHVREHHWYTQCSPHVQCLDCGSAATVT